MCHAQNEKHAIPASIALLTCCMVYILSVRLNVNGKKCESDSGLSSLSGLSAISPPVRLTITANADLLGLSYLLYSSTTLTKQRANHRLLLLRRGVAHLRASPVIARDSCIGNVRIPGCASTEPDTLPGWAGILVG